MAVSGQECYKVDQVGGKTGDLEGVSAETAPVSAPLAVLQASVDDKGRLKLPSEFLSYCEAMGISQVFITTLDLRMARIYPVTVWKVNEELFRKAGPNAAAASRMAFRARVYGGESDIDKSGRVLMPAKLRQELNLEKQPVWLEAHNDGFNVMNRAEFDRRLKDAQDNSAADLEALLSAGLK